MATLEGTTGGDTTLTGSDAEHDSIWGASGGDTLRGGPAAGTGGGNDFLDGGIGSDRIYGGDGNDTLIGGWDTSGDTLFGGAGTDTADYSRYLTDLLTGSTFTPVFGINNVAVNVNLATGTSTGLGSDQLFEIENVIGGGGNDSITGNVGTNLLQGGGGNDTIDGGDGNDTIEGGLGSDSLLGGNGTDLLSYANSATAVNADLTLGSATGEGSDTVSGFENLTGSSLDDTLTADGSANVIHGGSGSDQLFALGGNDSVIGGIGADTIYGGAGSDTVDGGTDSDVIYGGSAGQPSSTFIANGTFTAGGTGWSGTDLEFNTEGTYLLTSSTNAVAEIDGNLNQTTVMEQTFTVSEAISAQLTFRGIVRSQATVGVDGYRVEVLDSLGNVILTQTILPGSNVSPNWTSYALDFNFPAAGTYTLRFTEVGDGNSLGALVDDVQITTLVDVDVDFVDVLSGGDGNDTIFGGVGADTISGDANADLLYGDTGNDTIYGGLDDDRIYGGSGADLAYGGTGNDTLYGDVGHDTLDGGEGADQIYGGDGNDSVLAGDGDDIVDAGTGDDLVYGGLDADTLYGGIGLDTLYGDSGNDLLEGAEGADRLYGGDGNDIVLAGDGDDIVDAGAGDDRVYGGLDADTISGGTGLDTLYGDAGNDAIFGGAENDVLFGGLGMDSLYAGDDRDLISTAFNDVLGIESVFGGGGGVDNDTLQVDITGFGWESIDLVYDPGNSENGTITFFGPGPGFPVIGTVTFTDIENLVIVCFTAGTRILTADGLVVVEDLTAGDMVVTRDNGLQPLRWVGSRTLSLADLRARPELQPVRIGAGALGEVGPERSIMLSPQHRVLIEGARAEMYFCETEVLVPAKHLLSLPEVTRALPSEGVTYVHILFNRHEIVLSEGIWTESFQPAERTLNALEDAARAEILALFPELTTDETVFPAARMSLKAHEARVLISG